MRVVFRVDASLKIGTGHVMRCLTLAKMLKENGLNIEFICRKHKGNLINKINSSGFNVYELEILEEAKVDNKLAHSQWLEVTQQQDANDCINILKLQKCDWLIVDHYALDEYWQKKLKTHYKKLMVIDDLADRKHLCNILLDQSYGRKYKDYLTLVPEECKLLLGSKYALLRPEFAEWRAYSLERRSRPEFKQLLINMGGVDLNNVTESILEELKTCSLPSDINIIIVMGINNPYLESVTTKMSTIPYKIDIKVDVDNMAEIMANSDIAIGAAGSTTWERCCLGLPTIQIVTAKNQNAIAKSLVKNNAIKLLKDVKDLSRIINDVSNWMTNLSYISRQVSDGSGLIRVMNEIIIKKNYE